MTAALLAGARGVAVHGHIAAARLRAPDGLSVQIACCAVDASGFSSNQLSRNDARAALRLPGNAAVLLVEGGVREPSGRCLRSPRASPAPSQCVPGLEGPCPALARQAEVRGCDDFVRTGADTILAGLAVADAVLDLDPVSSGAASAMIDAGLATGLPVVGYRHGPAAMLPRPLAICVDYAENTANEIAAGVAELLGIATRGGSIASEARQYLRQNRSPERAALAYLRGAHAMTQH